MQLAVGNEGHFAPLTGCVSNAKRPRSGSDDTPDWQPMVSFVSIQSPNSVLLRLLTFASQGSFSNTLGANACSRPEAVVAGEMHLPGVKGGSPARRRGQAFGERWRPPPNLPRCAWAESVHAPSVLDCFLSFQSGNCVPLPLISAQCCYSSEHGTAANFGHLQARLPLAAGETWPATIMAAGRPLCPQFLLDWN